MDQNMSEKVDYKKLLKPLYSPPRGGFHIVDVPEMNYLMVDGKGNPNTSADYQSSVEVLYTMSYGNKVRFESYNEGLSVQFLYTGAYENESSTIANLHQFIRNNGYKLAGKHHEIYLGDPRKTLPEKLQTILRQPVKK